MGFHAKERVRREKSCVPTSSWPTYSFTAGLNVIRLGADLEDISPAPELTGHLGPPPPTTIAESPDDEVFSGIAGLNVGAVIMRFVELQGKYRVSYDGEDLLNTFDLLANVFFSRRWGLSYRFKASQTTAENTLLYHLGGITYAF